MGKILRENIALNLGIVLICISLVFGTLSLLFMTNIEAYHEIDRNRYEGGKLLSEFAKIALIVGGVMVISGEALLIYKTKLLDLTKDEKNEPKKECNKLKK